TAARERIPRDRDSDDDVAREAIGPDVGRELERAHALRPERAAGIAAHGGDRRRIVEPLARTVAVVDHDDRGARGPDGGEPRGGEEREGEGAHGQRPSPEGTGPQSTWSLPSEPTVATICCFNPGPWSFQPPPAFVGGVWRHAPPCACGAIALGAGVSRPGGGS